MNVSPYIAREARRLEIGRFADYRRMAPRTQREAGMEFLPWEERLEPLRPWAVILRRAAWAAILASALVWAARIFGLSP